MSENAITLTELFNKSGTAMRIYDLGRRIRSLGRDEFERIEAISTPYPTPYLHHAWIALVLWNPKQNSENAVWFLKLPLDEQGFMIPAVRDDIVNRLLTNVQHSVDGVPVEDSLKENPFMFKPSDEKMAIFHAKAALDQGLAASAFYEPVQQFIADPTLSTGWENLSLQGLADFIVRLDATDNQSNLARSIANLPDALTAQILALLEHAQPDLELSKTLADLVADTLKNSGDPIKISLLLRALSGSRESSFLIESLKEVLNSDASRSAEVLSAVATRCEGALMDPSTLKLFLERLAAGESGQTGFSRILADLMYLPVHRVLIVQALRSAETSPKLKSATAAMFGSAF